MSGFLKELVERNGWILSRDGDVAVSGGMERTGMKNDANSLVFCHPNTRDYQVLFGWQYEPQSQPTWFPWMDLVADGKAWIYGGY